MHQARIRDRSTEIQLQECGNATTTPESDACKPTPSLNRNFASPSLKGQYHLEFSSVNEADQLQAKPDRNFGSMGINSSSQEQLSRSAMTRNNAAQHFFDRECCTANQDRLANFRQLTAERPSAIQSANSVQLRRAIQRRFGKYFRSGAGWPRLVGVRKPSSLTR